MEIESVKPFLATMVPFVGGVLILAARKNKNLREGCSLVAGILMFFVVLSMLPSVLDGSILHFTLFTLLPSVPRGFRVDGLGLLLALVSSFTWILTTLYSIGYMRGLNKHAQTRYYFFFAVTLFATMGADFSNNWFTLFIAYLGFNTPLLAAQEKKYYELADGEADPKESQCIVVDVSFRFCSEIPKISDYGGGRFTTKEYMPRDKQAI